ncbi:MAG: prolyl oligopeptidase family serine peptidase, partial [Myxococcota bacterium]|nr:prolyl oligopeptidase family serine peptidase [Myxococcota bacterium]
TAPRPPARCASPPGMSLCLSPQPRPRVPPPPRGTPGAEQAALNARARRGAVVETIHGRDVADPYRALEEDSPDTWEWIDAQTAATRRYIDERTDAGRVERLAALMSIGSIRDPAVAGGRVFYRKRGGDADQAALFVAVPGAEPRPLVDPNILGSRIAIDWHHPSPSGRYVAYGLSREGDERSTLHVIDVDSGERLDEAIPHAKWCRLSWLNDETGFYYTRYPRPGEPDHDPADEDAYFAHLFFHRLGAGPDGADDPLAFRLALRTDFVMPSVSPDDRWVVLNHFRGWSRSEVLLLDRAAPGPAPIPVDVGGDHLVAGEIHRDRLYLLTNQDRPKYRIVAAPLGSPADRTAWREIVPEGEWAIEEFGVARDALVVEYLENVASAVRLFDLDGRPAGEIDLPVPGYVDGPAVERRGDDVAFVFESFFHPPALFLHDPASATPRLVDAVASDVDPSEYEMRRETARSADGTPINVYLAHRGDLPRDGARPVLAQAYGGFNVPVLPRFRSHTLYWLERGGVLATANLRGGSEFGEEWHRAGMLGNKPRVFEDFEAVLRLLPTTGLTSPERIAILGASNGGLLMGAMVVRCPDAFRAAVAYVGLYDMVRFDRFPPAEIWTTEYGDPDDPSAFEYLHAYSPYHSAIDGTAYPAVLVETADRDTRVSWKHSTKFAARLQEATSSDRPILFYMDRSVGHGAGTGLSDAIRERARMYAFLEAELGM